MSKRLLALFACLVLLGATPALAKPTPAPQQQSTNSLVRGSVSKRPFAVMIDNHPDAYPQTGLSSATIVFEALAEYGITRYMAIFVPGITNDVPTVGPVRSARLYFVQWAMGFRALYTHAGGSPQALELLDKTQDVVNLDALKRASGAYFSRSNKRSAPHNLFTGTPSLAKAAAALKVADLQNAEIGYLFKADAPSTATATQINYFFIYKQEMVGWTYDAASNAYLRLRRGKTAIDSASGKQLRTRNIVVMEVKERKIAGDPKGRIEQDVLGSGAAKVFLDGTQIDATWKKESASGPLRFFNTSGSEIQFNNGQIWISAVPNLANLSVK